MLPSSRLVSKIAPKLSKYVILAKQEVEPSHTYTSDNTLDLAMIGAAPFNMLVKRKKAKIYAISMQNIKYQLNK